MNMLSIVFSVIAVVVSFIAVWKTHFSSFSLLIASGNLSLRIYPIKSGKENWYLPSLLVPINFINKGAKSGIVNNCRITLHYTGIDIPNNKEYFYAIREIEAKDVKRIDKYRFNWIKEIEHRDWTPFGINNRESLVKYLLFESRWEKPVVQKEPIICTLEINSSSDNKWRAYGNWKIYIGMWTWVLTANEGGQITFSSKRASKKLRFKTVPEDLHKFTGTKKKIPDSNKKTDSSKLDYKPNKSKSIESHKY